MLICNVIWESDCNFCTREFLRRLILFNGVITICLVRFAKHLKSLFCKINTNAHMVLFYTTQFGFFYSNSIIADYDLHYVVINYSEQNI